LWVAAGVLLLGAAIALVSVSSTTLGQAGDEEPVPATADPDTAPATGVDAGAEPTRMTSHCAVGAPPWRVDCGHGARGAPHARATETSTD
jgi:hypothetical protein